MPKKARKKEKTKIKLSYEEYQRLLSYKKFFENSPDLCYKIMPDGTIADCNKTVLKTLGYKKNGIIGKPLITTVYAPESRKKAKQLFSKWKRDGVLRNERLQVITKKGKRIWVELNVNSVKDKKGKLLHSISIQRIIDEQKKAEELLRESEEMYKSLIEASPEAMTVTDLKGNVIYASPQTLKLHGYKSEKEVLGKNALMFIAPKDRKKAMMNLKRTLKEGIIRNVEYTFIKKDGSTFPAELSASLIKDADGKPKAFMAITRDITERKKVEEEIRKRTEELKKFSKFAIGRELRMIELKKEINELCKRLGEKPRYSVK